MYIMNILEALYFFLNKGKKNFEKEIIDGYHYSVNIRNRKMKTKLVTTFEDNYVYYPLILIPDEDRIEFINKLKHTNDIVYFNVKALLVYNISGSVLTVPFFYDETTKEVLSNNPVDIEIDNYMNKIAKDLINNFKLVIPKKYMLRII